MDLTRRSFLKGVGAVSVGLLFPRKLARVLESLERDLVAEQDTLDQQPTSADIVVVPDAAFRPERLVVHPAIAQFFVIEDIRVGALSQNVQTLPADLFVSDAPTPVLSLDTASAGVEIRFRVRYVGDDPCGARFQAMLIGRAVDRVGRLVLPIDSGCAIVG